MKFLFAFFILFISCKLSSQKQLEKLPSNINSTKYDEVGPILSKENDILYFTRVGDPDYVKVISNRKKVEKKTVKSVLRNILSQISGKEIESPENSSFNQDIFLTRIADNNFGPVEHPGYPLNNAFPNSVCATFIDEEALVVINRFDEDGGLEKGFSKVNINKDGSYGFPQAMDVYEFDNLGNEVSITMSKDAEQIFISMNRGDSKGKTDIYLSIRVGANVWSRPEPINNLNTIFKESAPYLSRDKKRLYFASDRPGSQGGMDIYVSDRQDYTYKNWSEPRLLPVPINSEFDDSQPYLDNTEDYLYFTSKRDGTVDIFRYHLTAPKELEKEVTISIRIIDEATGEPVRGEIYWGIAHEMGFEGFFRTYNGLYEVTLTKNELVKFKVIKRGHTGDEVIIDPLELIQDEVTKYDLDLYVRKGNLPPSAKSELPDPFGKKRKITLRNIYFERSEAEVLPQSYPELGKLIRVLKDVPSLYIRVEGHSDNIGDKDLLQKLSEERAQSIKDYLVQKGINPVRIETIGYGDAFPLNDNMTESERKRNRRVEIRVLEE